LMEESASVSPEPSDLLQFDSKEPQPNPESITEAPQTKDMEATVPEVEPSKILVIEEKPHNHAIDFFELFILKTQEATANTPLKADEITSLLELEKSQANAWLKRGVAEGKIKKLQRPVRYQAADKSENQASLF